MMKQYIKPYILVGMLFLIGNTTLLSAENILKILEGYGRDSIATFSTQSAQAEAAKVFNLILEPDGKVTVEKAEQYLVNMKSSAMKAYLSVMLADYAFVNNAYDSGLRYLKRAVEEHDPIRNDSYYRMVLDRAQKSIAESSGKNDENKASILSGSNPTAIKKEPLIENVKLDTNPEPQVVIVAPEPSKEELIPVPEKAINFRIQVGAFSIQENANKKKKYFEEGGYPVEINTREITAGYLYIVRVGAYESYDEAKKALVELKSKYPSEDGIVIKVAEK
ncbi:MAG: SPOR domain-containing protein [Candidatus Marinimicrobia bacterium]|nr:SPOR domain-containing protein [Candidatus Neomarinimicrobiota bacterium]